MTNGCLEPSHVRAEPNAFEADGSTTPTEMTKNNTAVLWLWSCSWYYTWDERYIMGFCKVTHRKAYRPCQGAACIHSQHGRLHVACDPLCLQLISQVGWLSDVCQVINMLCFLTFARWDNIFTGIFKKKIFFFKLADSMSSACTLRNIQQRYILNTQKDRFCYPVQISGGCCGDLGC